MLTQVAAVSRINRQITSKRPAQRLVGGDQGAQPLVDLAIHTLPALLNRDHRKQADTDAEERNDRQAQQRGDERMQRAEIETAQLDLREELDRMKYRPFEHCPTRPPQTKAVAVNKRQHKDQNNVFRFV